MNNIEELNKKAEELKLMKDLKGLNKLCKDNGVDEEDAADYMEGYIENLFTPFIFAMGKLNEEKKKLDLPTEMIYYTDSIMELAKDPSLATAICSPDKNLVGALGALLKVASKNRKEIPEAIVKAAGYNGKIFTGNIDKVVFKDTVRKYYMEG